jgi:hypothetical protein
MNEHMRIESAGAPNAVGGPGASSAEAFSGYRAGQEAAGSARVSAPMDGPEFQNALKKLTRVIDAGKPLRHDVPRGFYLNLRV